MSALAHDFPFDPTYGYHLDQLLALSAPPEPPEFEELWRNRYSMARFIDPDLKLRECRRQHSRFRQFDLNYHSTDDFEIGGWLLVPKEEEVHRAVIVAHGYGGRHAPDFDLPIDNAALFFPCCRGLSRSRRADIPDRPAEHVLHDIDKLDRYILRGCVEDIWLAVTALLQEFPHTQGRIGFLGSSFGGGVGAMALAWDPRVQRAHLHLPSFGHQPLRITLPSVGSAEAVRIYAGKIDQVLPTLQHYDAALAAKYIRIPTHIAAALFDPAVPPPGQFAIYNALAGPKQLFILKGGHYEHPLRCEQEQQLRTELQSFFADL